MGGAVVIGQGIEVAALAAGPAQEHQPYRVLTAVLNACVSGGWVLREDGGRAQEGGLAALAAGGRWSGLVESTLGHGVHRSGVHMGERLVDALDGGVHIVRRGVRAAGAGTAHQRCGITVAHGGDRGVGGQGQGTIVFQQDDALIGNGLGYGDTPLERLLTVGTLKSVVIAVPAGGSRRLGRRARPFAQKRVQRGSEIIGADGEHQRENQEERHNGDGDGTEFAHAHLELASFTHRHSSLLQICVFPPSWP